MSLYESPKPEIPSFSFSYAAGSDTGKLRSKNEDSFTCLPAQNLWVVADGMGGHDAGDFASATITRQAAKFANQAHLEDSILLLEENFLHSNQIIREHAAKMGKNVTIGSTLTALFTWQNLMFVLWAGDSRVYRLRDGKLKRLTEDHSFVEELVRLGKLNAAEAEAHPAANVVLNAIGINDQIVIDMEYFSIEDNDIYLLCSDGLYKEMDDSLIEQKLQQHEDLEKLKQSLIQTALDHGGSDNCTVILVKAKAIADS